MIVAGTFCIDATESSDWPDQNTRFPVRHVDWCDAFAFCRWAGKRLCARPGGGHAPTDQASAGDATQSEWYAACSHGGAHLYPYGDSFVADTCDTAPSGSLVVVGKYAGCIGGYDGLHDMSGSVEEWEDACYPPDSPDASCFGRGGHFAMTDKETTCDTAISHPRITHDGGVGESPAIGIRCCADLTPSSP